MTITAYLCPMHTSLLKYIWVPGLIIFMVAAAVMGITSGMDGVGDMPWLVMMVALLFNNVYYDVTNLFRPRWVRNMALSYAIFGVMLVGLYFIAAGTAAVHIRDLPPLQKFLGLVIIFKVLLTGLAGLYRVVLKFVGHDQAR